VLPLPISALKSGSPVLGNPANRNRAVPLTYEQFRYAFANAVSEDEARQLYEEFAVPAPGKPPRPAPRSGRPAAACSGSAPSSRPR
jgi:non-heme chloroperoxidase